MRTIKELEQSALTLRAKLQEEGKDPLDSMFTVTFDERCLILQEPFTSVTIDHRNKRFCGMKLHVIGSG